ncbi:AAA family ATPase [Streptomyces erythrogriseus]
MPFGQLRRYAVRRLFGTYNHDIPLDELEPTILTGANGTGKSTILRSISWISKGDWVSLSRLEFDQIRLDFEGAQLTVGRSRGGSLTVRLDRPTVKPKVWEYSSPPEALFQLQLPHDESEWLFELDLDSREQSKWAHQKERVYRYLAHQEEKTPAWVSRVTDSFPTLLVSDQRLAPERQTRPKKRGSGDTVEVVTAIEAAVSHINNEVQRFKSLYGTASQNLDRDFPRRVFSAISSQRAYESRSNITQRFAAVQDLRASLAATGLIDADEVDESIADLPLENPDSLALISTYLSDTQQKLSTFEPLRRRLEPFMAFLRRHYRDKKVSIDAQQGFRIYSSRTGEDINPVHLSSGEQQMFILSHKLLFESSRGTLVMIDEPELSLHVLWQSTFIDDLVEISEVSGTYFMLATHSPALIAGRTDLRRSLDG